MDKIYLVMDFVEHDLKALMQSMKTPFTIGTNEARSALSYFRSIAAERNHRLAELSSYALIVTVLY